jgi:hypothetical protein
MGLLSGRPDDTSAGLTDPNDIVVPEWVVERLPDPGAILLDLLGGLHEESLSAAAAEIARVRHPTGGLPKALRPDVKLSPKSGPLYLLEWITAGDYIALDVWATARLHGQRKRQIADISRNIVSSQGIPAAATWVLVSRRDNTPKLDILADMLENHYAERTGTITNDMVIKSFRKWQR